MSDCICDVSTRLWCKIGVSDGLLIIFGIVTKFWNFLKNLAHLLQSIFGGNMLHSMKSKFQNILPPKIHCSKFCNFLKIWYTYYNVFLVVICYTPWKVNFKIYYHQKYIVVRFEIFLKIWHTYYEVFVVVICYTPWKVNFKIYYHQKYIVVRFVIF